MDMMKNSVLKNTEISNTDIIQQYANRVNSFSSQYGKEHGEAYTALNIAKGSLQIYPRYGDFKEAFVVRTYGPWWQMTNFNMRNSNKTPYGFISKDYAEVAFQEKVFIDKIEIYETYNPGAIVSLYAFDYSINKWVQIWSIFDDGNYKSNHQALHRPLPPPASRKFAPNLKLKDIFTNLIRVEFADYSHEYYTELDGVALFGYRIKPKDSILIADNVTEKVEHVERVERLLSTEEKQLGFLDLPTELKHLIIKRLDLISFLNLRSTCQSLKEICSDPTVFNELNLQPYWNNIDNDLLDSIKDALKDVNLINLSWTKNLNTDILKMIFKNSTETLTSLKLSCCQYVDDDMLQFICENCKMINELDLQSCEIITKFQSISNLSDLKKLNLYRTKIKSNDLISIIHSCKSLEYLNIGSCIRIEAIQNVLSNLEKANLNLKGLDLWRCDNLNDGLLSLGRACTNLEELDIGWCKFPFSTLRTMITSCKKLKKLYLTAIRVSDEELNCISSNLPDLEQLDILGSSSVSRDAVERVLAKCKKLKFFDISFCSNITNAYPDIVSDMRRRYPNCAIKKSYQER